MRAWSLEIVPTASAAVVKEATPFTVIPDNNPAGVVDSISVTETGQLKQIKVWLDITHTWIGDLKVQLAAPSGKSVVLHNRTGSGQDNLIRSFAVASLAALQGFSGESIAGLWTLTVVDNAGRDVGKLNKWGFEITL